MQKIPQFLTIIIISVLLVGCIKLNSGRAANNIKLFNLANHLHKQFEDNGVIHKDSYLNSYLNKVGKKILPNIKGANTDDYNFYILKDSNVNAFAAVNGNIYFTLGLLSRIQNESQLSHIIAHEVSHVVKKHAQQKNINHELYHSISNTGDILLLGLNFTRTPYNALLKNYSREHELEADADALEALSLSGYDLQQIEAVFFKVLNRQKKIKASSGSIWDTHPSNIERAQETRKIIENGKVKVNKNGWVGVKEYAKMRRKAIEENIMLQIADEHYALALENVMELISSNSNNPYYYYLKGEVFRKMGDNPKHSAKEHAWLYSEEFNVKLLENFVNKKEQFYSAATQSYNKSLKLNPQYNSSYRGLGLVKYKMGQYRKATKLLKDYLRKAAAPPDKLYVKYILKKIRNLQ